MKTTTAERTMRWDRAASRLTVTVLHAGRKRPEVAEYDVREFDADFGRAFSVVKMGASGEPVERRDVMVGSPGGEHDGCTCEDATYRQRPCRHYLAVKKLLDLGLIGGAK